MWQNASIFKSQAEARAVWEHLQQELITETTDLTIVTILYGTQWHVVAVAPQPPGRHVQAIVQRHLDKGTHVTLPDHMVTSLLHRRAKKFKNAIPAQTTKGLLYEGHSHEATGYIARGGATYEDLLRVLPRMVPAILAQGIPFIEAYRAHYAVRLEYDIRLNFIGAAYLEYLPYIELLKQVSLTSVMHADRYMFTESARTMHTTVSDNDMTWNIRHDLWIEHDIPQEHLITGMSIKAIYVRSLYPKETIDRLPLHSAIKEALHTTLSHFTDMWSITVINPVTQVIASYTYDQRTTRWTLDAETVCPYDKCEKTTVQELTQRYSQETLMRIVPRYVTIAGMQDTPIILPCEQCQTNMETIAAWLHTANRQIHLDYAISSDPEPFPIKTMSYVERQHVPRHHGKGKPKQKTVQVDVPYTYVTYDVSVHTHTKGGHALSTRADTEHRGNWLTTHGSEDIIYIKRDIAPVKRHYRGTRYRSLINRVVQGLQKNGDERYELVQEEDGSYTVIGTVTYPQGRYVPMLRPDVRKQHVIKKVTASRFNNTL
jgi:hypothetical protein